MLLKNIAINLALIAAAVAYWCGYQEGFYIIAFYIGFQCLMMLFSIMLLVVIPDATEDSRNKLKAELPEKKLKISPVIFWFAIFRSFLISVSGMLYSGIMLAILTFIGTVVISCMRMELYENNDE